MARFLLVHGAAHGAWCWRDVIPNLEALGHTARAIDLPSHGADDTPAETVTLEQYAKAINSAIDQPTILVGHSMGGYPITLAAEISPENVAGLLYLCAYTPWPELSLADMRKQATTQPLVEAIQMSEDRRTMTFDPAMVEAKFFHDCPEGTLEYARENLCVQPVAPMETPVSVERAGNVPRGFIICKDDRAIPPELQRKMAERLPPETVYELNTGHSPFFASPKELAAILDRFSGATGTSS